jgi:tetratricopeptide (TPR) repeat protein
MNTRSSKNTLKTLFALLFFPIFFWSCQQYGTFVTYFNTFYNMERLMDEAEDEFAFQEEKIRIAPRVFVPEPKIEFDHGTRQGPPPFCQEFIVNQTQRQPVAIKLDSIIIKGSKILAKRPRGEYVQGSLYLMAKTYFYKEEWLPSQVKCGELIDKFPDGELSPDAHLLLSKGLLIQQKFYSGKIMLSRTVDIAWQLKRYDILSEAFRLQAELALYQDDLEGALRPYKQTIVQSESGEMQAKWQLDMAALLFRIRKFDRAVNEFRKVHSFSPDYLTKFEAYIYESSCLSRTGRFEEAEEILEDLSNDGKWEEWTDYIYAQKLQNERMKRNYAVANEEEVDDEKILDMEFYADSLYVNNPALAAYYFEKGMDYYDASDYKEARSQFAKARMAKMPATFDASKLFTLINEWDIKRRKIKQFQFKYSDGEYPDSVRSDIALQYFEIGRIHFQLQNEDSIYYYYQLAAENADPADIESAKYLFAYSRSLRETNPYKADSLLDVIVEYHPMTEYGQEAMDLLGYTQAMVIDTAAELYQSGTDLMKYGDNYYAVRQLWKIYSDFPESDYAPRALYTIGWMYERDFKKLDSAKFYYDILMRHYPESEYAKDIKLTIQYKLAVDSGEPIPDSLQTPRLGQAPVSKTLDQLKREQEMQTQYKQRDPVKETGLSPAELLRNPGKLLENAKGLMKDPTQVIKNLEVPKIPKSKEEFMNAAEEQLMPNLKLDTSGSNVKEPNFPSDTTGNK